MDKLIENTAKQHSVTRLRRQPLYAATRLRCAVAMLVLAFAVMLCALPSLAEARECVAPAAAAESAATLLWPAPAGC